MPRRSSGLLPGQAVFTSVDYEARLGTDHVLYLIRGEDGQLETNACIGSHAGPPNPDETAHFVPQLEGSGGSATPALGPAILAGLGVVVLAAAALAVALRRRLIARRAH